MKMNSEGKKRKPFTALDRILIIAAILLFLAAAVLFAWDPVKNYLRLQKTTAIVSQIQEGQATIIVKSDALPISGEGYEEIIDPAATTVEASAPQNTTTPTPLPEDVVLTALGTIKIDKINLNLPLLDDAGVVPLRYGAGMLAGTAMPGEDGNCVILGHRMKAYGSLFNRLGEMAVGDSVLITTLDGTQYEYLVDEIIPKLDPANLGDYIDKSDGTGKQLTLVTCTPTGVGSHRLLVIGHLKES